MSVTPVAGISHRLPVAASECTLADVVNKRWKDMSPRTRRFVIIVASIEGLLKIIALVDLARRPRSQVRGSKLGWAAAITFLNSAGAVPIAYLTRGRRK
jgi:hypothetical protein